MGIERQHLQFHREILALPELLRDPVLVIGEQEVLPDAICEEFPRSTLRDSLITRGLANVEVLDLFGHDLGTWYHDLDVPVPEEEWEQYALVYDVGTLEHVFDFRRALESCLRAVQVGGHVVLHIPVCGYYDHGFHTLSPEAVSSSLEMNQFNVVYSKFSDKNGEPIDKPRPGLDVLLWIVGRKLASIELFVCPKQERWKR